MPKRIMMIQVQVSEDYDSPKDLVNRLPLVLEESPPHSPSLTSRYGASSRISSNSSFEKTSGNSFPSSELLLELTYSDPKDSKLYTEPGVDPEGEDLIYKLYVGGEYYYCRPYRPNYSAAFPNRRREFNGLPETNVDASVYEDVGNNDNATSARDCVTIISVSPATPQVIMSGLSSPSPTDSGGRDTTTIGSETSSDRGSFTINSIRRCHGAKCNCRKSPSTNSTTTGQKCQQHSMEPLYENLDFHRVKISIPGSKPVMLHDHHHSQYMGSKRHLPPVNSRIVRGQRVKNKRPISGETMNESDRKRFEKFGYSSNEVWNWLYIEDELALQGAQAGSKRTSNIIPEQLKDLYSVPTKTHRSQTLKEPEANGQIESDLTKTVEVQFSPQEFFTASSRLAHLDLDGFETFVGNTLEKAIAKKQKEKHRRAREEAAAAAASMSPSTGQESNSLYDTARTVTITEVPTHSPLDVRMESIKESAPNHSNTTNHNNNNNNDNNTSNNNNNSQANNRTTCQTCIASGESSCSSALSSLESVRSHGIRSSSVSGCSETLGSELVNSVNRSNNSISAQNGHPAPIKPARTRPNHSQSSSETLTHSTKPYQILEMSNRQGLEDTLRPGQNGKDLPELYESSSESSYSKYIPMFGSVKPILIDPQVPLDRQEWYHGSITRVEAENVLRLHKEGSYLIRNSESSKLDYSLSVKSSHGFMHMRIQRDSTSAKFILGQFSKPFPSVPEMVNHYSMNRLPIRGAEHMCLLRPICEQLL
ncbi:hypothetical protein TCAL_02951 [Tigriopus californicus]|uniref:SH2 domain-containing adapter protein D n=1 Tax=Tigriopus californicus TaxID=6832 RepID=A0A553NP19_TIGCA|nr:hypothetical protein TCAL_02951 [Tigriopus californicus]